MKDALWLGQNLSLEKLEATAIIIRKVRKIQRALLPLIVFLMPSQLSYHFWPSWAYVFGLRIDYLSTAVYLTEVLIVLLLSCWIFEIVLNKKTNFFLKKDGIALLLLCTLSLINIFSSGYPFATAISWAKFYILFLLALYLIKLRNYDLGKWLIAPLCYSLIFFALIGIAQFIKRGSLGGAFYYLGERSFSAATPGIALLSFFGREYLRPYSTFPHPNAFAGYYFISLLFLFAVSKRPRSAFQDIFVPTIAFLVFILTFSKSIFLSMAEILFFGFYFKRSRPSIKVLNIIITVFFLSSLSILLFNGRILNFSFGPLASRSLKERIELLSISGSILKDRGLWGVGKNVFIEEIPSVYYGNRISWILQPVHNVFLLIFAELGIFGFSLLFVFLGYLAKRVYAARNIILAFLLLAILTTSFFDHYWYTLEQNELLLTVIIGVLFNDEYLLKFKNA